MEADAGNAGNDGNDGNAENAPEFSTNTDLNPSQVTSAGEIQPQREGTIVLESYEVAAWIAFFMILGGYLWSILASWSEGYSWRTKRDEGTELDMACMRESLRRIEKEVSEATWLRAKLHRMEDTLYEAHGKLDLAVAEIVKPKPAPRKRRNTTTAKGE